MENRNTAVAEDLQFHGRSESNPNANKEKSTKIFNVSLLVTLNRN